MVKETKSYKLRTTAEKDLEDIFDYSLQQFGLHKTEQYIQEIVATFSAIIQGDKHIKHFEYISPDLLGCHSQSHTIFYKHTPFGIEIIRILHKSMDTERHI